MKNRPLDGYTYGYQPASALVTAISLPNAANINNSYDTLARLRQTALVNYWGHTQDAASYIPDPLGLRTNLVIKGSVLDIDILGGGLVGLGHGAQATSGISRGDLSCDESREPAGGDFPG